MLPNNRPICLIDQTDVPVGLVSRRLPVNYLKCRGAISRKEHIWAPKLGFHISGPGGAESSSLQISPLKHTYWIW